MTPDTLAPVPPLFPGEPAGLRPCPQCHRGSYAAAPRTLL